MPYIKRHMEDRVTELSRSMPIVVLTGPRHAGKTTMLQHLAQQEGIGRTYVSLEDVMLRNLAEKDPRMFLSKHNPPVIIDEVQHAPALLAYIQAFVQESPAPGSFWLTGSQLFRLPSAVRKSIKECGAQLRLSSLSQRELAGASCMPFVADYDYLQRNSQPPATEQELFDRLWRGCMPSMLNNPSADRSVFYSSYLSNYVTRDVREFSSPMAAPCFHRFLATAASRISQPVNYQALADEVGIDQLTAHAWLDLLSMMGILFLLHPSPNKAFRHMMRRPKLYFEDTGLACYLTRALSPQAAQGAIGDALLENFAMSQLIKNYWNAGQNPPIHYYRDRDFREIDVILEHERKLCPIDIRRTDVPDKRLLKNFQILDDPAINAGTGAILCTASQLSSLDSRSLIVPIGML